MKKRQIALVLVALIVLSCAVTALAATSIPAPPFCSVCGTTNIWKTGTMWTTSNPPQIVYESWRCGNGHTFKNYPGTLAR